MTTVQTVTSTDGTTIAFDQVGDGLAVVLIGGAFNDRSTVAGLAAVLAPDMTAITYDRRGRGDSAVTGDHPDRAVEREVEDLAAVIDAIGGSAAVFGHSSGAILALEAAERGVAIDRLAVYEPPYVVDGTRPRPGKDLADRLHALTVGGDDRDGAAALFLEEAVAMPAEVVAGMRNNDPVWGWFAGLAHTLHYDVSLCGPGAELPVARFAAMTVPTLAIDGGDSPDWMRQATRLVAETVPGAHYLTLDGQDHSVLHNPQALRPALTEFFTA